MPETATAKEVKSGPTIQRMFSAIAPRYDLLNHLLSLNRDKSWRRRAVELLLAGGRPEARYLDACAGTLEQQVGDDGSSVRDVRDGGAIERGLLFRRLYRGDHTGRAIARRTQDLRRADATIRSDGRQIGERATDIDSDRGSLDRR